MKIKTKSMLSFLLSLAVLGLPLVAFGQAFDPANCEGNPYNLSCKTPTEVLSALLQFLLAILTFLGVIGFVVSGIIYITAGGAGKADTARHWLQYSIIGMIVGLAGYIVIITITKLLNADASV